MTDQTKPPEALRRARTVFCGWCGQQFEGRDRAEYAMQHVRGCQLNPQVEEIARLSRELDRANCIHGTRACGALTTGYCHAHALQKAEARVAELETALSKTQSAAKTLVAGADRRVSEARAHELAAREAIRTLDSEREANAVLTDELEQARQRITEMEAALANYTETHERWEPIVDALYETGVHMVTEAGEPYDKRTCWAEVARNVVARIAELERVNEELREDREFYRAWLKKEQSR